MRGPTVKALTITPLLQSQIDRVLRAAALYPNADEGFAPLEREQLLLAEEVLAQYARQQHRLDRLPAKATAASPIGPVVEVTIRAKRRRA